MSASQFSPYQLVTLRTYQRAPLLAEDPKKKMLLHSLSETKERFKLTIAGYVILDDHIHLLFSIPPEHECSAVMNDFRANFMRASRKTAPLLDREATTPCWEHRIEYCSAYSTDELRAYLDFIHYDPVRHQVVPRAADYRWSSLRARIAQGHYSESWAEMGPPAAIARVVRNFAGRANDS